MNESIQSIPVSLSDAGYQAGKNLSLLDNNAIYLIDNCVKFPEELQDSEREQITSGLRLYYSENHPATEYAIIDGNYVAIDQLPKDAKVFERKKIGVDYAFSFTQHEFGQLAKVDKNAHEIVKKIRTACSKFVHDAIKALTAKAKRIIAERNGETKTRDQAKNYDTWLNDTLSSIKSRAKTATARGDATVPDTKKLDAAVIAFKTKLGL